MARNTTTIELILEDGKVLQSTSRVNAALQSVEATANKLGNVSGFDSFGDKVQQFIQNPLQSAGDMAKSFLSTMGPVGTGVVAAAGAFAAFGTVAMSSARALGEYGDRIGDLSIRTGLSVKEVEQFSFAMKRAGGDISSVETSMRMLSRGMGENSDEGKKARQGLEAIGVRARDVHGVLRPMSQIFLEISSGLNRMTDTATRNTVAMQLFGRAGLEILPDLLELSEGVKRAKELGLGPSDNDIQQFAKYQQQIAEVDVLWERLKRNMKQPLAAVVSVAMKWFLAEKPENDERARASSKFAGTEWQDPMDPAFMGAWKGRLPTADSAASYMKADQADLAALRTSDSRISAYRGSSIDDRIKAATEKLKEAEEKLIPGQLLKAGELEAAESARALVKNLEAQKEAIAEADRKLKAWVDERTKFLEKLTDTYASEFARPLLGLGSPFSPKQAAVEGLPEDLMRLSVSRGMQEYPLGALPDRRITTSGYRGSDRVAGLVETQGALAESRAAIEEKRLATNRAATEHQERMIQLLSGPGGEVAAINSIYALRMKLAADEFAAKKDQAAFDAAQDEARYTREERLAELRKRGMDEYKTSVMSAFDALISGGRGGFGSFLKAQGLGVARQVVGNVAGETYKSGRLSVTDNPDSTVGKLLQGTPFGADPMKGAATSLDMAGVKLSLAADKLMAVSSTGGGGGLVRDLGALAGGLPGINLGSNVIGAIPGQPPVSSAITDSLAKIGVTMPTQKPGMNLGRGIGLASAVGGGAFGVYSGIKSGGVQGALTAGGSALSAVGAGIMAASPASGPAAPILMGIGAALGMATMLFGDPKKKRAEELAAASESRKYAEPTGSSYSQDIYGRSLDYDYRGQMRPVIVNNYNVQAMDAKSFVEWGKANGAAVAEVNTSAITSGNAEDFLGTVRQYL